MWGPGGLRKQHKDTREHLPERQALLLLRRSPAGLRLFCVKASSKRPYKMRHWARQNKGIRRARAWRIQEHKECGSCWRPAGHRRFIARICGNERRQRHGDCRTTSASAASGGAYTPRRSRCTIKPPFYGHHIWRLRKATWSACASGATRRRTHRRGEARETSARHRNGGSPERKVQSRWSLPGERASKRRGWARAQTREQQSDGRAMPHGKTITKKDGAGGGQSAKARRHSAGLRQGGG